MKSKAYTDGRLAFLDGRQAIECPKRNARARADWNAGWTAACEEERAKHMSVHHICSGDGAAVVTRLKQWADENL